jgi:hypothetical protein
MSPRAIADIPTANTDQFAGHIRAAREKRQPAVAVVGKRRER